MSKLAQSVEPTTATELTPKQRQMLQVELEVYAGLYQQQQELAADIAATKERLDALRADVGDTTVRVEGFGSVTAVAGGTTKSLNKKKLCADFGITPKQLDSCYTEKPKRGHVLVTVPGMKAEKGDDE